MDCPRVNGLSSENEEPEQLTKYSDVLPDASFTPPPNIVDEVLWICGVFVRVLELVDAPLRTVVPRSQLGTFGRDDIKVTALNMCNVYFAYSLQVTAEW